MLKSIRHIFEILGIEAEHVKLEIENFCVTEDDMWTDDDNKRNCFYK